MTKINRRAKINRKAFMGAASKLAGEAFDRVSSDLGRQLDDATVEILASVERALSTDAAPKAAKTRRDPKPAKVTSGKRRNHCKACGAEGFQTKTCGKTHNVIGQVVVPATSSRTIAPKKTMPRERALKEIRAEQIAARLAGKKPKRARAIELDDDEEEPDVRAPTLRELTGDE